MRQVEVAIIGAGPAGLAAAAQASRHGAQVVLIDEQAAAGGHLRWALAAQAGPPDEIDGLPGFQAAQVLADELPDTVELLAGTVAWGLFDDRVIATAGNADADQIRAERIILATGSTDIVWPFPGWTLPGVMTARAASILMHLHRVRPGERALIIGDDAQLAEDLRMSGIEVVARVASPEVVVAGGDGLLEWVELGGERHAVDLALFALGAQPDPELALHARCALVYAPADGCHLPLRSETLETSVPGVYVAGDAGGICTTAQAIAEGQLASEAAVGGTSVGKLRASLTALHTQRQTAPLWSTGAFPDDLVIDREEQITAGEIRQAISEGALTINDVKRRTRAGMGVSQGIFSSRTIAAMLHAQAGIPLEELAPMTARPPARLVSLEHMAALFTDVLA
jgi:thioredoxin reductase